MTVEDLILDVEQHVDIKATPEKAFAAVLHRLGKGNTTARRAIAAHCCWSRSRVDAGIAIAETGSDTCGGSCRLSKPRRLLELSGPMFMSYPATNHVEVKSRAVFRRLPGRAAASRPGDDRSEHRKGVARAGVTCSPTKKGLRVTA